MVVAKSPRFGPIRPPLVSSDKEINTSASKSKPKRHKDVPSRFLSSSNSSSNSSTSSTSTSYSSNSNSSSRRFPSPLLTPRPSTPSTLTGLGRSHSVDRSKSRPTTASKPQDSLNSNAAKSLFTTTRSLSVSFQGESFFYQTSKAKNNISPTPARKPTPERRKSDVKAESNASSHSQRWPAARSLSSCLTRSVNLSAENGKKDSVLDSVRLLQQSRLSFDGPNGIDSDSDSVSSGSGSGANEISRSNFISRGLSVPARYWQENNSRLKSSNVRKNLVDSSVASSPRAVRSPSPSKNVGATARSIASPLRRSSSNGSSSNMTSNINCSNNSGLRSSSPLHDRQQVGNAPSIISFAAEVRRAKKGESKIEEAHMLRVFDNRHLQWRWASARANAALMVQRSVAEKNLYNAWIATSELRDSVTRRRIKLQLMTQSLKLTSVLNEQMAYLEEWSHIDKDHASSLSGAIEALKASTLRLPVVGGAKADLQVVKDAVGSAVDVMQAMGSSICSLLSKVEGTTVLASELSKMAEQEQTLLDQSRILLSLVAEMHVKRYSLHAHIIQQKCKPSQVHM